MGNPGVPTGPVKPGVPVAGPLYGDFPARETVAVEGALRYAGEGTERGPLAGGDEAETEAGVSPWFVGRGVGLECGGGG